MTKNLKLLLWISMSVVGLLLLTLIMIASMPMFNRGSSSVGTGSSGLDRMLGFGDSVSVGNAVTTASPEFLAKSTEPSMFFPPSGGQTAAEVDPKIIKTSYLQVVVDSVAKSVEKLTQIVSDKKGFVQDSSISELTDGTHTGTFTTRVPIKEFDSTLAEIRKLSNKVETEQTSGTDVTEQYTDLEARLNNAKEQEKAYLNILSRAVTVEDILKVQTELWNIRAVIESYEGQIKYLQNQTQYSTITVYMTEEASVSIPTKEFRPLSVIREAAQALIRAFQALAIYAIWFIILGVGILLPLSLVIFAIVKIGKRVWNRYQK